MPVAKDSKDIEGAQYCFKTEPLTIPKGETGGLRKFEGVAYSGEPIVDHWYWDRVIFDLSSIQMKDRIPALLDHRPDKRTGAVTNYNVSNDKGLEVSGTLLTNEFGTSVAQDSDDGFPWQMSVRILRGRLQGLKRGSCAAKKITCWSYPAIRRYCRLIYLNAWKQPWQNTPQRLQPTRSPMMALNLCVACCAPPPLAG